MWFTVRPQPSPRPKLVVIPPSSGVPGEALMRFGKLLAEVAAKSGKRVAIIASADRAMCGIDRWPESGAVPER